MTYLEWGCGGSTFAALRYADHVVSIENSKAWCDKVVETEVAQCNILLGRLHFLCVNAGETSDEYARPLSPKNYTFSLYRDVMDHFDYSADFVFIDGRLRLATALGMLFPNIYAPNHSYRFICLHLHSPPPFLELHGLPL